jgi:hypothetical protein
MRLCVRGVWSFVPTLAFALGALAAESAQAQIYAWRTDDGGYAFTDDEKAIPPRYRARAETRPDASLAGYRRYTAQDERATRSYEERLARRLEYLRARNERAAELAAAPAAGAAAREGLSLRTGSRNGGGLDIPIGSGDEPVVVETIFVRPDGKAVVQPTRVTRQGGRVVAIEKPRSREWNVLTDIHDEEDLLENRE